jgi:hypothetical protein
MNTPLKIVALHKDSNGRLVELPDTSKYLNSKQLIPFVGDALTLCGDDYKTVSIAANDFKNIVTVIRRWYNYSSYDVALICDYVVF